MNVGYYWDEFNVGDEFVTGKILMDPQMVSQFAMVTGDDNPFHLSKKGTEGSPYKKPVVHGMLIMSLFVGQNRKLGILKGTSLGVLEVNWKFRRPVYVEDEIYFQIIVGDKIETSREDRGILKRNVTVINQQDEELCYGTFVNLVKRDECIWRRNK